MTSGKKRPTPEMCFYTFLTAMDPHYQLAQHHQMLAEKLAAVERGEVKRLLVCMPPRHGKSQQTSRLFPAWYLGRNPTKEVLFTTYGQRLADDFGRWVRNLISDDRYQEHFPDCRPAKDSKGARRFHTSLGGGYTAVGAGGPLTGRGGDLVIIDDPHKNRQEAMSELIRGQVISWFQSTLYTRLAPEAALVVVQTRWHPNDLAGHLLATQADQWEVLSFPALDESGNALWPERWPAERLLEIKQTIGSQAFEALYQQHPTPPEGSIVKRSWLRFYRELPKVIRTWWSWDTAIKPGQDNDYSVGQLWAQCETGYYLVHQWRDRVAYPELKRQVQLLFQKHPTPEVLIEDRASGQQLVQDFSRGMGGGGVMPVIGLIPGRDMPLSKVERLNLVSPLFESGRVFLPEEAPWVSDYVEELTAFPTARHDDQVDATAQALCRLLARRDPGFLML